jgi:hypothetical protein
MQGEQGKSRAPSGREARPEKPRYEIVNILSREDLARFYRVHLAHSYRSGMWVIRIAGAALLALGVVDVLYLGGGSATFEIGCGAGFLLLSFLLGPLVGLSAARSFSGAGRARYRFFSDAFEVKYEAGIERHPYAEVRRILVSRGALYLYIGKMQAFVLNAEALGGRLAELAAFLSMKTGRKVEPVGHAS